MSKSQKIAKNPLLLPIVDQSVYSLHSKILEGIVRKQIWEYMEKNYLITANQKHAYCKNHSTTTALVDMTDQWLSAMDNGKFVGCGIINSF